MAEMSLVQKLLANRVNPWMYRRILRPFFERSLRLPRDSVLLELGCGSGQAALIAHQLYRPQSFVVTDYDSSEVDLARATFARALGEVPDAVALGTADALHLPLADSTFDAVFAFFVLHHLGGRRQGGRQSALTTALMEVTRVLKPEGQFVYSEIVHKREIRAFFEDRAFVAVGRENLLAMADLAIVRKPAGPETSAAH